MPKKYQKNFIDRYFQPKRDANDEMTYTRAQKIVSEGFGIRARPVDKEKITLNAVLPYLAMN